VAWLPPQHNQSHLVSKQENHGLEIKFRKFCPHNISLMLCLVLLHDINLPDGTNGFTSPKEVRGTKFYHL
jgi:hypothetical protein